MEKINYLGLPNCYRLTNGSVELIVTTDVGPRILRYALVGGENVLGECRNVSVETEWGVWRPYGGHRLWLAPEANPRSYSPDNDRVEFGPRGDSEARLTQSADPRTGIQKEIVVALDAEGSNVTLTHRVTNRGAWAVELAPWALTIMRGGGEAIIPQEPYGAHPEHLLPARPLVLWPYTNLSDARYTLGQKFIRLRSDAARPEPEKFGVANKRGWAAYRVAGTLFVKHFPYEEGASYPDLGCNNEVFTAGSFIEVESLGPVARVEPGGSVEHVERWQLFGGAEAGADEQEVEAMLRSLATTQA